MRLLIVDDSVVARAMLARIVGDDAGFIVVGECDRASHAIAWLANNRTDIVLLDIEMPGQNGLAALSEIIHAGRGAHVIMVSSSTPKGASATLEALALGATDAIAKPGSGGLGRHFAIELIDRLARLRLARTAAPRDVPGSFNLRSPKSGAVRCVAIGASTGGLHALSEFFSALPLTFYAPILVTQHLPPTFMPFFADQLGAMSGRPCTVARDGTSIDRGEIYVAPGHAHLTCEQIGSSVVARHLSGSVSNRSMPSVNPMFESVAATFGNQGVGIVFSGMGRDGAEGAACLAAAGADVLAQDTQSATIWGMPGAVARAGIASMIASPADLARHLVRRGTAK